ncbi:protein SLC31A2-like isoform X2 [Euwallacea similis]|uniref:protein SLC31A2-like isoform X2 n=1 Tax=Euwallacea similis TaxID=1736056 RepID=UPI00344E2D28
MNQEYFYFGADLGVFLIKGIDVKSTGGLVAVCIFVACLSFFFEFLRYVQTKCKQRELKIRAKQIKMLCPTESATLLAQTITDTRNPLNITLYDRALLFGSEVSLWVLLQVLGYIIMLSVMLYDAWLLISAVIGGGLGYFIFGQKFMKINLENCHIIREAYCTQICGESEKATIGSPGTSQKYDVLF